MEGNSKSGSTPKNGTSKLSWEISGTIRDVKWTDIYMIQERSLIEYNSCEKMATFVNKKCFVPTVKGVAVIKGIGRGKQCLLEWFNKPNYQEYIRFHKIFILRGDMEITDNIDIVQVCPLIQTSKKRTSVRQKTLLLEKGLVCSKRIKRNCRLNNTTK